VVITAAVINQISSIALFLINRVQVSKEADSLSIEDSANSNSYRSITSSDVNSSVSYREQDPTEGHNHRKKSAKARQLSTHDIVAIVLSIHKRELSLSRIQYKHKLGWKISASSATSLSAVNNKSQTMDRSDPGNGAQAQFNE
jgi:hypothetical protein